MPPTTQRPETTGQRLKAGAGRAWETVRLFKPGATKRNLRAAEDAARAVADYSRSVADVVERRGTPSKAEELRAGADRLTARADALTPEAMKRQRREDMTLPDQGSVYFRGPYMPRPLNKNWFTIWVLGFPWMLVRGLTPYCLVVALATIALGVASKTPLGVTLGLVVGVPGVVVPVYGCCTRWRHNWMALLSTCLVPATIVALVVIVRTSHR